MTLLARRYATALFQAARDGGALDAVAKDLAALQPVLTDRALRAVLTSPDVTGPERQRLLGRLGEGRHPLVSSLLQVAQHRQRLEMLPELEPAFRTLVMEARGEVHGVVETARPLDPGDLERLQTLGQSLSGRRVVFSVRVDPDLIGGVRLYIKNQLYDGSVRTALEQLEQQLLQAPV